MSSATCRFCDRRVKLDARGLVLHKHRRPGSDEVCEGSWDVPKEVSQKMSHESVEPMLTLKAEVDIRPKDVMWLMRKLAKDPALLTSLSPRELDSLAESCTSVNAVCEELLTKA